MKKKKKVIYIIVVLVVLVLMYLVGQFIGDKIYYARYYSVSNLTNYEKYSEGLNIKDTISVKTNKLEESQYLAFNDIKIRNDFSNFVILEEPQSIFENVKYVLYDENSKTKASFWMSILETKVSMFGTEVHVFNSGDVRYEETDAKKFFEKNNITNDVELIKYLIETKDKKTSVFTDIQDLKDNYAIHYLASIIYTNVESVTLIEGDLEGYILSYNESMNNTKEISIIKNNKNYVFTIIGLDYFTDEYIKELLNTIVIK